MGFLAAQPLHHHKSRKPYITTSHAQLSPCRRSLLADAPVLVTFTLKSDDATAVAQALAAAALDGTLDPELLALLGGQLSGYAIIDGQVCSTGPGLGDVGPMAPGAGAKPCAIHPPPLPLQGRTVYSKVRSVTTRSIESPAPAPSAESPAAAPAVEQLDPIPATLQVRQHRFCLLVLACSGQPRAPATCLTSASLHTASHLQSMPWAEAPSQAPADGTTVTTASTNTAAPKKKKSNLGAILGGAIGGGVGGLAVLAAAAYFLMRKKGSPSSFAVGNPTFAPQSGAAEWGGIPTSRLKGRACMLCMAVTGSDPAAAASTCCRQRGRHRHSGRAQGCPCQGWPGAGGGGSGASNIASAGSANRRVCCS